MSKHSPCPCGSGKLLNRCCGPIVDDHARARTAEELMRSRYTAFTLGRDDYLKKSWAPETRPEEIDVDNSQIRWTGLEVEECTGGGREDSEGLVRFTASFMSGGQLCRLHEESSFVRREQRWYYVDGKSSSSCARPGRNDPCPCGSGKKYKKCCR